MGFRLPIALKRSSPTVSDVPKGYLAVYVGDVSKMKRFVVPVSVLNQPSFQELFESKFGINHPMGGLTIPCPEDAFTHLIARLNASA